MPTTNYLTNQQFRAAKSRLTRAINSGNNQKVIDVVDAEFAAWIDGDFAFPDDWHRWERAREDAIRRHQLTQARWAM